MMEMMTQPMESSMIADDTMIWPRLRRMKFISRITMATIFIDAMESAVPRNSEVMIRNSGRGSIESGRNSPRTNPHTNGTIMPAPEILSAA